MATFRWGALLRPGDKPLKVSRHRMFEPQRGLPVDGLWLWSWVCRLECPAPHRSGWSVCCRFHAIVQGERHLAQWHEATLEAISFRRPLLKKALSVVTVGTFDTLRCD